MLKLIKFDFNLILSSLVWRVYYTLFILSLTVMVPYATYQVITNTEFNLIPTIFMACNILMFFTFAAPFCKNNASKTGGLYTRILYSLPTSKKMILGSKYLLLISYCIVLTLYVFVLSSITFMILGNTPSWVFLQNFIGSILTCIIFFGSLYLASFFTTNHYTVVSTFIYSISIAGFFILVEAVEILNFRWYLLVLSILVMCVSFLISALFHRYRSY